jgi:hypothetical protein
LLVAVEQLRSRLPRKPYASHRRPRCRSPAVRAAAERFLKSLQKIARSRRPAHHLRHSVPRGEAGRPGDPRWQAIRRGSTRRRGQPPEPQAGEARPPRRDPKPVQRDLSARRKAAEQRQRQIQMQGHASLFRDRRANLHPVTSAEEQRPDRRQGHQHRGLIPEPRAGALPPSLPDYEERGARPSPPSPKAERRRRLAGVRQVDRSRRLHRAAGQSPRSCRPAGTVCAL